MIEKERPASHNLIYRYVNVYYNDFVRKKSMIWKIRYYVCRVISLIWIAYIRVIIVFMFFKTYFIDVEMYIIVIGLR
jgi:hypothetical protein